MATTMTETVTMIKPRLGRVRFIEADTSADPWDCDYFAVPKAKTVTHATRTLHDLRPSIFQSPSPYTLKTHAFTAVKHISILHSAPFTSSSFYDPTTLRTHYLPEIESLVKSVLGARKVFILTCHVREKEALPPPKTVSELAKEREADPNDEPEPCGLKVDVSKLDLSKTMVGDIWNPKSRAGPARTVHIDFSPHGARQNISNKRMDILEEARDIIVAEDVAIAAGLSYEGRRYGIYSVWRPLKTAKRDPLIMCDPNSIEVKRDLVESMNKSPGVKGDFLNGLEREPDEVLFLQFFDSHAEQEGRPVGVPHGSPELIGAEGEEVRESVEARVFVVW